MVAGGGRRATSARVCYCGRARSTCTVERNIFNRAYDIAKGWITNDVTANYIATIIVARVQAKKHKVHLGSEAERTLPSAQLPHARDRRTDKDLHVSRSAAVVKKSQKQRKAWRF